MSSRSSPWNQAAGTFDARRIRPPQASPSLERTPPCSLAGDPDIIVQSLAEAADHPEPVVEDQARGLVSDRPGRIALDLAPGLPIGRGPDVVPVAEVVAPD